MSAEYKLVYFTGCPNHPPAEEMLKALEVNFQLICQNEVDESSPFRNYSSPTLLRGDEIIFGSPAEGGGCSIKLPTKEELLKLL